MMNKGDMLNIGEVKNPNEKLTFTRRELHETFHTQEQLIERSLLGANLGRSHEGARDIYKVVGYKKTLSFDDYEARYSRQDMAARIIDAPAKATWKDSPEIVEDREEDSEGKPSDFEEKWKELEKRLRIFHHLERIDRLSGVGRYGVLFIGLKDGQANLSTEVSTESLGKPEDVIYFQSYDEGDAEVDKFI